MSKHTKSQSVPPVKEQDSPAIFTQYQSYLLRLWQETPQTPWRVSLQSTVNNERFGFSSLESLFAFLESQIEMESAE